MERTWTKSCVALWASPGLWQGHSYRNSWGRRRSTKMKSDPQTPPTSVPSHCRSLRKFVAFKARSTVSSLSPWSPWGFAPASSIEPLTCSVQGDPQQVWRPCPPHMHTRSPGRPPRPHPCTDSSALCLGRPSRSRAVTETKANRGLKNSTTRLKIKMNLLSPSRYIYQSKIQVVCF